MGLVLTIQARPALLSFGTLAILIQDSAIAEKITKDSLDVKMEEQKVIDDKNK
jgi:hypothetical protein